MEEFFKEYVNIILVAALSSWVAAQLIKVSIHAIRYRTFNPERLFGSGGMPSSHSSTVCTLAIMISKTEGITSAVFALSMVFALVVMYDASGVRRAAGLHAKQINRLRHIVDELDEEMLDDLDEKMDEDDDDEEADPDDTKELKEFIGHTPLQVLFGALLGILIGMAFPVELFG